MSEERGGEEQVQPGRRMVVPGVTRLYVRVPLERIGVLVGKGGEVLRRVMEKTGTKIAVDSANGTVVIEPASPATSPFQMLKAQDFVRAIAYGFSPERAMRVLEEDQVLIVIDLKQYVGSSPNHLTRVKGRIIGEKGKARKNLEEMGGVYISVYDDYVAFIGDYESANAVKEAIELLIQGRQHSTVYRYLDRIMTRVKRREKLELWYKEGPPWS
ncbi:MAG: RNA-processing protein [Thermoprotei archaeon]|nr:MAG: RNA-processing protein [Thermoprotei archaeon]